MRDGFIITIKNRRYPDGFACPCGNKYFVSGGVCGGGFDVEEAMDCPVCKRPYTYDSMDATCHGHIDDAPIREYKGPELGSMKAI